MTIDPVVDRQEIVVQPGQGIRRIEVQRYFQRIGLPRVADVGEVMGCHRFAVQSLPGHQRRAIRVKRRQCLAHVAQRRGGQGNDRQRPEDLHRAPPAVHR